MTSGPLEDRITRAAEAADLYESTVQALLTFAAFVTHDGTELRPDSHFGFGRRLEIVATQEEAVGEDTPGQGEEEAEEVEPLTVTPDLVAQKSASYGIVAEVKGGLAQGSDVWDSHLDQLELYDRPMIGWWTDSEMIPKANAVLLVHRSRSRQFVQYLETEIAEGRRSLSANAAVIEFVRSNQVSSNYSFTVEWGGIIDEDLSLAESAEVPLEKVVNEFGEIQFYDAEPPLPMFLEFLWGEFFGRIGDLEFDPDKRHWPFLVTVKGVTEELQKAYGSKAPALARDDRSCEFPRRKWVKRALDALVALELALPGGEVDEYTVLVRNIGRGRDLRSEFVRRLFAKSGSSSDMKPSPGPDQTELPLLDD